MKEYRLVYVPELKRKLLVGPKEIDGQRPEFGNREHIELVRRLETCRGRKVLMPEVGETYHKRLVLGANLETVTFEKGGKTSTVKRKYFINRYSK